jgi:hypothetical protein
VAFASLAQVYFIDKEVQYSLRDYMQESCPNLVGHVNRMKERYVAHTSGLVISGPVYLFSYRKVHMCHFTNVEIHSRVIVIVLSLTSVYRTCAVNIQL